MTRPANPLRGETQVTVAGATYLLRPSFEALVAAEGEVGSLFALVERASTGSLTVNEITALIWHCIVDDNRPEKAVLGQGLVTLGLLEAIKPVRAILTEVLKGEA